MILIGFYFKVTVTKNIFTQWLSLQRRAHMGGMHVLQTALVLILISYFAGKELFKYVPGVLNGVKVVRIGETADLLKEFHASGIGGHSGFNKTNETMKIRFWWPKMTHDIREYVSFRMLPVTFQFLCVVIIVMKNVCK